MLDTFYNTILNLEFLLAIIIFVLLSLITAPYGRFRRKGWGPMISSRIAWIIMEMPSLLMPIFFFIFNPYTTVSLIFLLIWLSHYFHRTLIYPFRISDPAKPFSIVIMSWGFIFNLMNSYVIFFLLCSQILYLTVPLWSIFILVDFNRNLCIVPSLFHVAK